MRIYSNTQKELFDIALLPELSLYRENDLFSTFTDLKLRFINREFIIGVEGNKKPQPRFRYFHSSRWIGKYFVNLGRSMRFHLLPMINIYHVGSKVYDTSICWLCVEIHITK